MIKSVMGGKAIQMGKWFYCYYADGVCWFRLFGRGLRFKNVDKHGLIFSERVGKVIMIGKWSIKYLKNVR